MVFSEDCLQNSTTTNKEDTYASGSLGSILTESLRDARGIVCPREMQRIVFNIDSGFQLKKRVIFPVLLLPPSRGGEAESLAALG